jgi:hypothetical protein
MLSLKVRDDQIYAKEVATEFIDKLICDAVGSRIMESILRLTSDEIVQELYDSYFKENLADLSFDKHANFAIQRLFERLTNPESVNHAVTNLFFSIIDLICTICNSP